MEIFKRERVRRTVRGMLAAAALLCVISGSAFAAESAPPAPNPQEQAELAKFAAYTGTIEVIAANEGNGLHAFLNENAGKTVT